MLQVEDFWKLINNLKPPSMLEGSANYHFFKEGVQPLWEDPANKHGGKWVLTVKDNVMVLNRIWIEVVSGGMGYVVVHVRASDWYSEGSIPG